jgi:hypothetical protein
MDGTVDSAAAEKSAVCRVDDRIHLLRCDVAAHGFQFGHQPILPPTLEAMTTKSAPAFTRPALAPGVLGAMALLVGLALLDSDAYLYVRFAVSVLALICCVFAGRAQQLWWLALLAPIVLIWNPVWPLELHGQWWVAGQFVAALAFIVVGILIKVPAEEEHRGRR